MVPGISLSALDSARARIRDHVTATPLLPLRRGVWIKAECLQPTGSFKVRGFFNAALSLHAADLARGLLTVSAGNAAQASAYVAHRLGVPSRVVTFDTAPAVKLEGIRRWGADIVTMSRPDLLAWMDRRGWEGEPETFVHPFADEDVMAGHGTVALEILDERPEVERILVPVGGGGLITGIASAVRARGHGAEVVGVQSEGYPLWPRCLEAGGPVTLQPHTIADGTTAPFDPGMFHRLRSHVTRWELVPEGRLRQAVGEAARTARLVLEGAGALALAALDQLPPGPPTVVIASGGNIDPSLLAELLRGAG